MLAGGAHDALADQLRPEAAAFHAAEEIGVVIAAAADVPDNVHHLVGAVGIMGGEPGAEQGRDLERQAYRDIGGADRSRIGGGGHDRLYLVIGDRGRSEEHTSELQSLMRISYAVFCLKKNKIITQKTI